MISPRDLKRFARFCAVGVCSLVLSAVALYVLHGVLRVEYIVAYAFAFFAANISAYLLNGRYTFSAKSMDAAGAVRYLTVNGAQLCVTTIVLAFLVSGLGHNYLRCAIAIGLLSAPLSYILQKTLTFKVACRSTIQDESVDRVSGI